MFTVLSSAVEAGLVNARGCVVWVSRDIGKEIQRRRIWARASEPFGPSTSAKECVIRILLIWFVGRAGSRIFERLLAAQWAGALSCPSRLLGPSAWTESEPSFSDPKRLTYREFGSSTSDKRDTIKSVNHKSLATHYFKSSF